MNKTILTLLLIFTLAGLTSSAQNAKSGEQYGHTLNLGLGIGGYSGYYSYVGHSMPVININYEFDVAKNFTLAPFISFSTYSNSYYWGNPNKNYPYKNYSYHETIIPIGGKGTYYFDDLLKANPKWDFYLAGSLGFAIVTTSWDSDYYGDENYYNHGSSMFLDLHIGAEYHFNSRLGAFLDLSTGVSTIGLAIHQRSLTSDKSSIAMGTAEIAKSTAHILVEIIEQVPNSVSKNQSQKQPVKQQPAKPNPKDETGKEQSNPQPNQGEEKKPH